MNSKVLDQINGVSIIENVTEAELSEGIQQRLGEKLLPIALENKQRIETYAISYRTSNGQISGYIVKPKKQEKVDSKFPCVIYNHGGTEDWSAVKIGQLYIDLAFLSLSGYVVFISQYSGIAGSEGRDEYGGSDVQDVLAFHTIATHLPYCDESRIGMIGESRGGMMTYQALTQVDWIKCAVSISGISDFFGSEKLRPEMKEVYDSLFGASESERIKRSAICWPEKFTKSAPILLLHGDNDDKVSHLDSMKLSEKLTHEGVPNELHIFKDGDHGLWSHARERNQLILDWLQKYL